MRCKSQKLFADFCAARVVCHCGLSPAVPRYHTSAVNPSLEVRTAQVCSVCPVQWYNKADALILRASLVSSPVVIRPMLNT